MIFKVLCFSLKNLTSDSHSISRKKDCLWFDLLGKKNLIWIYENIFLILENLGWYFGIHCCLHVPGFEISGRFDIYLSLYTGKIAVTFQWGTNFWNDDVLFICQKMDNYCLIFNPLTYLTNNSTYERLLVTKGKKKKEKQHLRWHCLGWCIGHKIDNCLSWYVTTMS